MKIKLITVGSIKTSWLTDGCAFFLDRISHDAQFELIELPASKQKDPEKQRSEECERILEKLEKIEGVVWILDETGKGMTSHKFSGELSKLSDQGKSITFVLGGAYGLTESVKKRATARIRLSEMTFPHELCRIIFLEQLYRALQIKKGSGYHH